MKVIVALFYPVGHANEAPSDIQKQEQHLQEVLIRAEHLEEQLEMESKGRAAAIRDKVHFDQLHLGLYVQKSASSTLRRSVLTTLTYQPSLSTLNCNRRHSRKG